MSGVRILHLSDSHIGAELPVRGRPKRSCRGDDLIESFQRALANDGVDLILHCGDVFDSPRPSAQAVAAAAEPLRELAQRGIPIVLVPGNHERDALSNSLLLSHQNIYIAAVPATWTFSLKGMKVAVSAFRCLRRNSAAAFVGAIEATGWHRHAADVRILAVHEAFDSAVCGPGNFRFRSREDVVERNHVPGAFDYVAAGHVHRHQILHGNGGAVPIVYSGSTDRISFAEIGEPKGSVIVEIDSNGLRHRFIDHPVRPMSIQLLNVNELSRSAVLEAAEKYLLGLPPDAVAQLRFTGFATNGNLRELNLTKLARRLRPDVLLSASFRAVEHSPSPARARVRSGCPFDVLDAPAVETTRVPVESVRLLPKTAGVYALFDSAGRLLYVGKSKDGRTRVRSHLTANGSNHFPGWAESVATVEFRLAGSELEALLIEAELIRLLRPPFNQQMRRWSRYAYLGSKTGRFEDLDKHDQPVGRLCVGPFRSIRQIRQIRDILLTVYHDVSIRWGASDAERLVRDFLLADGDSIVEHVPAWVYVTNGRRGKRRWPAEDCQEALRVAFARLNLLRQAAGLIGRTVPLSDTEGRPLFVQFRADRLCFTTAGEAPGHLSARPQYVPWIAKEIADVLTLAARYFAPQDASPTVPGLYFIQFLVKIGGSGSFWPGGPGGYGRAAITNVVAFFPVPRDARGCTPGGVNTHDESSTARILYAHLGGVHPGRFSGAGSKRRFGGCLLRSHRVPHNGNRLHELVLRGRHLW